MIIYQTDDESTLPLYPLEHIRVLPESHPVLGTRYPLYDLTTDTGHEYPRSVVLHPSHLSHSDMVVVEFTLFRKVLPEKILIGLLADKITRLTRAASSDENPSGSHVPSA